MAKRTFANSVADQMICSAIRTDQDTQRLSVPTRISVRHPKLQRMVIRAVEAYIEEPISPSLSAKDVKMSTRARLERVFRRYLNRSPKRYYMELRLQKARNLVMTNGYERYQRGLLPADLASPSCIFPNAIALTPQKHTYRERGQPYRRSENAAKTTPSSRPCCFKSVRWVLLTEECLERVLCSAV